MVHANYSMIYTSYSKVSATAFYMQTTA